MQLLPDIAIITEWGPFQCAANVGTKQSLVSTYANALSFQMILVYEFLFRHNPVPLFRLKHEYGPILPGLAG